MCLAVVDSFDFPPQTTTVSLCIPTASAILAFGSGNHPANWRQYQG